MLGDPIEDIRHLDRKNFIASRCEILGKTVECSSDIRSYRCYEPKKELWFIYSRNGVGQGFTFCLGFGKTISGVISIMKQTGNRSHEAQHSSALEKLMIAHNEIINAWFEHWSSQERSRIDLAFEKSQAATDNLGNEA